MRLPALSQSRRFVCNLANQRILPAILAGDTPSISSWLSLMIPVAVVVLDELDEPVKQTDQRRGVARRSVVAVKWA